MLLCLVSASVEHERLFFALKCVRNKLRKRLRSNLALCENESTEGVCCIVRFPFTHAHKVFLRNVKERHANEQDRVASRAAEVAAVGKLVGKDLSGEKGE